MHYTALNDVHVGLGAVMTDFAGWNMPMRYGSAVDEHEAVRTKAGMFDLSHMGQIRVEGPDAGATLDYALVTRPSAMPDGRARYSMIVAEDGGIIDDLIVYRNSETDYLVVANGANRERVVDELIARSAAINAQVAINDNTEARAMIAVQGPVSLDIVAEVVDDPDKLKALGYYRHEHHTIGGKPAHIARTGYTGERGYEIMVDANDAVELWNQLTEIGAPFGLQPAGLASRDSLRLEAGMPLYGHELNASITPAEGGQGRVVNLDHDFVGKSAIEEREASATLYGLVGEGRRAARAESDIYLDGEKIGQVTSGQLSPTLGHPIALALATPGLEPGTHVDVDVRGKTLPMTIVELPFYKSAN